MFTCTGQEGKSNVRGALERNLNDKRACEFVMYLFVSDNLRVVLCLQNSNYPKKL